MKRLLARVLNARREARARVAREADTLLARGEGAYGEARGRARSSRAHGDRNEARFWTCVAIEIANRAGHPIGERVAD